MKRWQRNLMIAAAGIVLILAGGIGLTAGTRPFLGPRSRALTGRTFARTPERLERGRYLVEAVSGCMDCHSPHDWTRHDAPILPGKEGAGQDFSLVEKGLPGRIVAPNLTPDPETGAGAWSDDALARAIREGIGHDGRALFPMMPYQHFRKLPDEDVASIVVYLRSLPPVHNSLPPTEVAFPVKYLMRSAPQPLDGPVPDPDLSDPVRRGAFLVNAAVCADCHTPDHMGQPLPGMDFAGGRLMDGAWGRVASANLTPDPSGIPYYDEDRFVTVLRTGYVGARRLNQIMPWSSFRNMTDGDLRAIYAYVKTLTPVKHSVDNTEAPTYCAVDKSSHGLGDRNKVK
jgi:mono/diheme cytochrome c family protein